MTLTRRQAIRQFWMLLASSPLLRGQDPEVAPRPVHQPDRIPPVEDLVNAFEYEQVARKMLSRPLYDHIAAGAGGEWTLRRNREFFDRITFRPRMLVDVSQMDLTQELFGEEMFAPILVGPTANHRRFHAEGELATAAGAAAAKATMILSHRSTVPAAEIAEKTGRPFWYQVVLEQDSNLTRDAIKSAVESGAKVVCLTVGSAYQPVLGRDVHNRYVKTAPAASGDASATGANPAWPPHPSRLNPRSNPELSWDLLDQVKEWAGVPVILKGIMSPDEASEAVSNGADGIVVSNHGGRVIDGAPATIEMLPKIADEVRGRVPLLVDGGFRRGTDILKALALGADAVLLGRPVLWGLAGYGAQGVQKLLEMFQFELALAMGLSGKPNLAAIDASLVKIHRWQEGAARNSAARGRVSAPSRGPTADRPLLWLQAGSAVGLDGAFNGVSGFLKILGNHGGRDLDAGV